MRQTYIKLFEGMDVPETFGGLFVVSNSDQELDVYCTSGRPDTYIRVSFNLVHAFMSHEEFSHPAIDSDDSSKPPLSEGSIYYYPLLEVGNSVWRSTFPDYRVQFQEDVKHIEILSLSNIVDILTSGEITAEIITETEFRNLREFIR